MKPLSLFIQRPTKQESYADLVNKVAKMLGKRYIVTLKLVEKMEPGALHALYEECTSKWRGRGFESAAHMFFTTRKSLKK